MSEVIAYGDHAWLWRCDDPVGPELSRSLNAWAKGLRQQPGVLDAVASYQELVLHLAQPLEHEFSQRQFELLQQGPTKFMSQAKGRRHRISVHYDQALLAQVATGWLVSWYVQLAETPFTRSHPWVSPLVSLFARA